MNDVEIYRRIDRINDDIRRLTNAKKSLVDQLSGGWVVCRCWPTGLEWHGGSISAGCIQYGTERGIFVPYLDERVKRFQSVRDAIFLLDWFVNANWKRHERNQHDVFYFLTQIEG